MPQHTDKLLGFVLRHYQPGQLDTRAALRRVTGEGAPARRLPIRWRQWAVAASLLALVLGGVYAYNAGLFSPAAPAPASTDSIAAPAPAQQPTPVTFHFDDTPLPEALQTIGRHYGVTLTADDPTKRLTGDIEATDLDETLHLIEQALGVRITRH